MNNFIFALFFLSIATMVSPGLAIAEDTRQLVKLPAPAEETLRQEMLDNLVAINEVLTLMAAGKITEAGQVAEVKLGMSAMGKHRDKPFDARPGPHMPPAMHSIGMDGHKAVSEFAAVAKTGDRDKALALLPNLTAACVGCHFSYRTR
jgi:hypothetical protein